MKSQRSSEVMKITELSQDTRIHLYSYHSLLLSYSLLGTVEPVGSFLSPAQLTESCHSALARE